VGKSTAGKGQLKVETQMLFREGRGRWCDYRTHHHYQRFGMKAKRWIKSVAAEHQHDTLNRCPHINSGPWRYGRNSQFSRTRNRFESFHKGVAIEPSFRGWGIKMNGSSTSGASTRPTLHASFGGAHTNHYACGENGHTVFNGGRTFSGGRT
jgi:hypothetical protein